MYEYMMILGVLTLEQRVKRWLANCGVDRGNRTGKLVHAAKRRTTAIAARFFFSFSRSSAVSEPAKKKQKIQLESRKQMERKS